MWPAALHTASHATSCADLDFGIPNFETFRKACTFPWLCSNATDRSSGVPLGGCGIKHMITAANGVKVRRTQRTCTCKQLTKPLVPPQIGVMGLIEKDWLVSLGAVDPHEVKYTDFVQAGSRLASELRSDGAEFVVAITHMREHNDKRVATDVKGVDLVLGGHDHFYKCVGQGGAGDGVHHA